MTLVNHVIELSNLEPQEGKDDLKDVDCGIAREPLHVCTQSAGQQRIQPTQQAMNGSSQGPVLSGFLFQLSACD